MSVPEKKRHKTGFWTNPKVKRFFDALCERSEVTKVSIDWSKFRQLDRKDRFERYNNSYLSLMYLKRKRELQGICVQCGIRKNMEEKNICKSCYDANHEKYLESD